jgi:hypothetical protein
LHQFVNHDRVFRIHNELRRRGIISWYARERFHGDTQKIISDGVRNSCCVVLFVTKKYCDLINSRPFQTPTHYQQEPITKTRRSSIFLPPPSSPTRSASSPVKASPKLTGYELEDYCFHEFRYALEHHGQPANNRIIPVVMDIRMKNIEKWKKEGNFSRAFPEPSSSLQHNRRSSSAKETTQKISSKQQSQQVLDFSDLYIDIEEKILLSRATLSGHLLSKTNDNNKTLTTTTAASSSFGASSASNLMKITTTTTTWSEENSSSSPTRATSPKKRPTTAPATSHSSNGTEFDLPDEDSSSNTTNSVVLQEKEFQRQCDLLAEMIRSTIF